MITLDISVQRFAAKLLYTRSRTADVMTIARAARTPFPGGGKGLNTTHAVYTREQCEMGGDTARLRARAPERSKALGRRCARPS